MFSNKRIHTAVTSLVTACLISSLVPSAYATSDATHLAALTKPGLSMQDLRYQFDTNDYTLPEPTAGRLPSLAIPAGYQEVAANRQIVLYVDHRTLGLMIRDRKSGYVWTSIPSKRELAQEQLNSDWQANVKSPLLLTYFTPDAMLNTGSLGSLGGVVKGFKRVTNGFACQLVFNQISTTMTVVVKLDDQGLIVSVPRNGIHEAGPDALASVQIYPFLGAVHKADMPGYMFVPDGSGALIRFTNNHAYFDEPFSGMIYGGDPAITQMAPSDGTTSDGSGAGNTMTNFSSQPIYMPVYGVVHGAGQNAFLAIVEKGDMEANIVAYPSGLTTNLNWVSAQFIVRNQYFQPTSQNLGGYQTFQKRSINTDMQIRYEFLTGSTANYVGMANAYRSYLTAHGDLQPKAQTSRTIPVDVELLGAETKPGLLGSQIIDMTSFTQAQGIVADMRRRGVTNIQLVYRGWSAGGLTNHNPTLFPVEGSLGGADGLRQLAHDLQGKGIPFYLYTDLTDAYGNSARFSVNQDAVRNITKQIITQWAMDPTETQGTRLASLMLYYVNPETAAGIARDAVNQLRELGAQGVAVNQTGWLLSSDFNARHPLDRPRAAQTYQGIAGMLQTRVGHLALYSPNSYLFKYADQILNTPTSSSQFMFETDSVPFLEIVLHGQVNYFAPFSNFNPNPRQQLLRLVDYGAYPSFYITANPSWMLKDTPSENIITSAYSDWRSEIASEYTRANQALSRVERASIVRRTVPDWGIVEDIYSNGVRIIINYRSVPALVNHVHVGAQTFVVEGSRSS